VSQLVTSLWRSAAEAQPREDADRRAVAQLEAFLGERAGAFWHELRWVILTGCCDWPRMLLRS
jgi:hypothetical protein